MNITRLFALLLAFVALNTLAARQFAHPGLSYTEADVERMRQAVSERAEPAYSTFLALEKSPYSAVRKLKPAPLTAIAEGRFNATVGADGRRVHDLALLYRLTDDERYADEAVSLLNNYKSLTNCSARGTAPLDNGKIYLMLEGAELLRDYPGWAAADRQAFADMLVYPAYSSAAFPEASYDGFNDENNAITFYWNIYNMDRARWGNQGLFAARALMAMGIFLDNEKMYDRALNYLSAKTARKDDIPYPKSRPVRGELLEQSEYLKTYTVNWVDSRDQFISDEALQYYIYPNGQSQEACRDQGHAMVGVGLYCDLAEMAKNQGDDLYGMLDNRILKGLEYACRYNLSYALGEPWEPAAYRSNPSLVTLDNNLFLQTDTRSLRWASVAPSPEGRENAFQNVRFLVQALSHYKQAGVDSADYYWLNAAVEHTIVDAVEDWGTSGHHYEWKGWGTLTKQIPLRDNSGLDASVELTDNTALTEYYTIQGVRLTSRPSLPGMYICRACNSFVKTFIR